jgi:hypothetical protein
MKTRTVCAIRTSWVKLILAGVLCLPSFTGALILSNVQVQLHSYVGDPIPDLLFFEEDVCEYGNGLEDQAYWWNSGGSKSTLGATGVASGTAFEFGEIFEFGQFRYMHEALSGELFDQIDQINLMPSFTIEGVSDQESADFKLSATNKNATGMDFTFTTGLKTLDINGGAYSFEFGFASDMGDLLDTFHVSFNTENKVNLLARISAVVQIKLSEYEAAPLPGVALDNSYILENPVYAECGAEPGYQLCWWNFDDDLLWDVTENTTKYVSIVETLGTAPEEVLAAVSDIFEMGRFHYIYQAQGHLGGPVERFEQITLTPSLLFHGEQVEKDFILSATEKDAAGMKFSFQTRNHVIVIDDTEYYFKLGFKDQAGEVVRYVQDFHVSFAQENTRLLVAKIWEPIMGDVDGDGLVNIMDAVILSMFLQEFNPTITVDSYNFHPELADVTCDGTIDDLDLQELNGYINGTVQALSCAQSLEFDCARSDLDIPEVECRALVDLYKSTNDGGQWKDWFQSSTACDWDGVSCENGSVTRLDLENKKLTELPGSIGDLRNLEILYLYENQLTSLPERIGNLKNLQTLYLENNQLTRLPERIGDLTDLEILHLGDNPRLSGPLPETFRALLSLNRFSFWDTNLCVPDTDAFEEWLGNIDYVYGNGDKGKPVLCPPPLLGDVNGDDSVTIVDALLVAQYYVDLPMEDPFYPSVADVDVDGKIDIRDALLIARYYVGLETELPPQ